MHGGESNKPLTKSERDAIAELRAHDKKRREQEQRDAAASAQLRWETFSPEGESLYLNRKAVQAHGIRFDGAVACVPLRDVDNVLWSLQRIAPDGKKLFHAGGRVAGCFHLIGAVQDRALLLIAEGYATSATLHAATGAAVACAMNCHNIGPVADALRKRYPNARLVICADDDAKTERVRGMNPGLQAAQEAARRLKCPCVKPEGLPDGATDFNDLASARGLGEVKAQLESVFAEISATAHKGASMSSTSQQAMNNELGAWPEPMMPSTARVPEIPADVLPDWLGEMASAVSKFTQTPSAMSVMMILAILGAVLQRRFEVSPYDDEYHEPLAIWTMVTMPSGSRKSAVSTKLLDVLVAWEKSESDRKRNEINRVFAAREVITKRIEQLKQNAGRIDDLTERAKIQEEIAAQKDALPAEIFAPRLFSGDVTAERLQQLLVEQDERIAIISDEPGIFQNLAGMYSGGMSSFDIYLKGHAGTSVRVDRAGRMAHLDKPALSMGLAIQPGILTDTGKAKRFRESGLMARFLYAVPKSNVGQRDVRARNPIPGDVSERWSDNIRALLSGMVSPLGAPRVLVFDDAAQEALLKLSEEVEKDQGDGGRFAHMADWTSKLPGAAARIAGLLEIAVSGTNAVNVTATNAAHAVRLARLLIPHAEAAFRLMGAPDAETDALALLDWIKRNQHTDFTQREAHKSLESRFRTVDRLLIAVKQLQEWSVLSKLLIQKNPRGAPSKYYQVNPKIFVDNSLKS